MVRTVVASVIKADISKYEEAVNKLNTLQTNAQTLEKIRQQRDKRAHLNIPRMWSYAERIGIQEKDIDSLNVIHVSGTKGKGSTCAFCESLLRHQGYRTGFFSSPHLVEVRERLAINGVPLEREKFATYFWEVYDKLNKTKAEHDDLMPNYFGFLTVMALHVFLREQVNVAILEVGIGGQYDSTNMVRHPMVCGVTSLGLDHTSILGTSIDKIAWHKAGIFKPGVSAFTVPQCPAAMTVLKQRAQEIGSSLSVCPEISGYGPDIKLGIKGSVQTLNASLALQLCNTWVESYKAKSQSASDDEERNIGAEKENISNKAYCDTQIAVPFTLTKQHLSGLEQCQWLGRNQTVRQPGTTFYLDGAHTVESIQQCVEWFKDESKLEKSEHNNGIYRVLIYNTTGDREPCSLISPLLSCEFDTVLFCPNIAYEKAMSADQTNNTVTRENQLKRCTTNKETWERLLLQEHEHGAGISNGGHVNGLPTNETQHTVTNGHLHTEINEKQTELHSVSDVKQNGRHGQQKHCELLTLSSISDCLNWISRRKESAEPKECFSSELDSSRLNGHSGSGCGTEEQKCDTDNHAVDISCANGGGDIGVNGDVGVKDSGTFKGQHIQVLVTGSIHLVGGVLRVLWDREP